MLEQEAGEIQKELYGSMQDMQMRTTSSQLPQHGKGSPSVQAVSGTSGHTEGAFVWEQVQQNWGAAAAASLSLQHPFPGMPCAQ